MKINFLSSAKIHEMKNIVVNRTIVNKLMYASNTILFVHFRKFFSSEKTVFVKESTIRKDIFIFQIIFSLIF